MSMDPEDRSKMVVEQPGESSKHACSLELLFAKGWKLGC